MASSGVTRGLKILLKTNKQAQESLGSWDELESAPGSRLTTLLAHNKVVIIVKAKLAVSETSS